MTRDIGDGDVVGVLFASEIAHVVKNDKRGGGGVKEHSEMQDRRRRRKLDASHRKKLLQAMDFELHREHVHHMFENT